MCQLSLIAVWAMVWSRSIRLFPFIFHLSSRGRVIDFIVTFHTYILLTIQVTAGNLPLSRFVESSDDGDSYGGDSDMSDGDGDGDAADDNGQRHDIPDTYSNDSWFYPITSRDHVQGFFDRCCHSD